MKKKGSLGRKILLAMTVLVIGMFLAGSAIFALTMRNVSATLASSNQSLNDTIGEKSSVYLTEQSQSRILQLAREKAGIADEIFADFKQDVCIVASLAEQIYSHPELYSARTVPLPDAQNDGKLTIQVLYSANTDPSDPQVAEELALISNTQDALMSINASQENMASIYVATESGFMVQADYISAKKFDESGDLMPLEAKERPWYRGAAETGGPFFTPVTQDAHTPRLGIMCGVPVYSGGRLMAVAGAGMYLDDMEALVYSVDLGESGNACIINENSQVLFSTYEDGTLAAVADAEDLRSSEDTALAGMAENAVSGGSGVTLLSVDGVSNYAAYAPMRTVGWSMIVFLTQEAVDSPTNRLLDSIDQMTDKSYQDATTITRNAAYLLLALLAAAVVIALVVSVAVSRRIVMPIQALTEEVGSMEGDNLDFRWDLDTDDETQMLANSFQSLTMRLKDYIRDIETITTERERISTELSLATRIQADMLPNAFPAYPNRSEFDIHAVMKPARAVGGDFYDFFLIDEDHLCMVMADVSGKGVPAALFMMASKIILKNYAMIGQTPAKILTETNTSLCDNNREEMFVTVWLGILEISTGKLTAANAGHEYPALMKDGRFSLMRDRHGFVIGGTDDSKYTEYEVVLKPGDKLFLYTDGIPEATNAANEMFGTDRMLTTLNRDPLASPKTILNTLLRSVDEFVKDAEQFDDLTILCLEYRGGTPADRKPADAGGMPG